MKLLYAFGLGALAMYYFDPQQGRMRREQARARLQGFRSRAESVVAEAQGVIETARERVL